MARFVFISSMAGSPWGGSEELWSQTAVRLRGEGHEVSASVPWHPQLSPRVLALEKHGIALSTSKLASRSQVTRAWRQVKRKLKVEFFQEQRWLRERKPDFVVISQGSNSDGVGWMKCCHEMNLPFAVVTQANSEIWWPADEASRQWAALHRAARKVFFVSRRNLELLQCQIGECLSNAEVIRNPFNVSSENPPAWPEENNTWKLACVARLEPTPKGQDLLLQALALPQWRGRPVEVSLYGAGPNEDNLRRLTESFALQCVIFRGHVNDVKQIWRENHLLVLPSRFEGLPLALVEAMWCARPSVVTDVGGNAEMCVDEETGFVAAAPSVHSLGEALERAWNRRADWESIGKAARARVEEAVPKDPAGDFARRMLELAAGR